MPLHQSKIGYTVRVMKKYSRFIFERYEFNPNTHRVILEYSLDGSETFTETIQLPTEGLDEAAMDTHELDAALFAMHLIGGISYFKTCCPREIVVKSGTLNKAQAKFWTAVYENGLGEFFFKNDIDFRNLVRFPAFSTSKPINWKRRNVVNRTEKRLLIPIGGGKDSIVTMELLRKSGARCTLLRMEPHPIIDEVAHVSGLPMLTLKRTLSPTLFELNKQGALNGHVPITAYLSILSSLVALLYGFDAVVMSNEGSADEGNVQFHGREINHQWSKSFAAEQLIGDYLHHWVSRDSEYFSLLRPLTELHVTKLFTQYPQYFSCFTSCNKNWKIAGDGPEGMWCRTCPKCAFVFALLAAFLDHQTVERIFGGNLYDDASLLPLYRQLLGIEGFKPFECVGTPAETVAAFLLTHERGDMDDTPVMQMFLSSTALPPKAKRKSLLASQFALGTQHRVPAAFAPLLPR